MAEKLVGKISEFKDGDRRIVFVGDQDCIRADRPAKG
jgi:hypothetical protein